MMWGRKYSPKVFVIAEYDESSAPILSGLLNRLVDESVFEYVSFETPYEIPIPDSIQQKLNSVYYSKYIAEVPREDLEWLLSAAPQSMAVDFFHFEPGHRIELAINDKSNFVITVRTPRLDEVLAWPELEQFDLEIHQRRQRTQFRPRATEAAPMRFAGMSPMDTTDEVIVVEVDGLGAADLYNFAHLEDIDLDFAAREIALRFRVLNEDLLPTHTLHLKFSGVAHLTVEAEPGALDDLRNVEFVDMFHSGRKFAGTEQNMSIRTSVIVLQFYAQLLEATVYPL